MTPWKPTVQGVNRPVAATIGINRFPRPALRRTPFHMLLLGILVASFCAPGICFAQAHPSWRLAEALREAGEYELAALEYLRAGFEAPELSAPAFERAALVLQLGGKHAEAGKLAGTGLTLLGAEAISGKLLFRRCMSLLLAGRWEPALCSSAAAGPGAGYADLISHLPRMSHVLEGRCRDSSAKPASPDAVVTRWREEDDRLCRRWTTLDAKSPALAGLLSAVLPGAGKAYVGRWGDAVFSLLLVASPGAISAYRFYSTGPSSASAWVTGGFAAVFYFANVYGSFTAARIYNEQRAEELRLEIRDRYLDRLDP